MPPESAFQRTAQTTHCSSAVRRSGGGPLSRLLATIYCLVSLSACVTAPGWPPPRTAADDDVLVSLATLALDDLARHGLPAAVCCLEVRGRSPSAALLARLPANSLPVLDRSQCRKTSVVGGYSYEERSAGGRAVLIHIAIDRWLDPTTVEAHYGWDHSTFAVRSYSGRLSFRDSRWVVADALWDHRSGLRRSTSACGGVTPDSEITQSQAICIATLAGFARGLEPWRAREEFSPAQRLARWLVFNTLSEHPCSPNPGDVMHISKTGGAVLVVRRQIVIGDPPPGDEPPQPFPVPVTPDTPEPP